MAVLYYKFKSAKQFTEFPICERYISVREFKTLIFESKIGRGRDFDLIITNADTGEDYDVESSMILAKTKLLLRRIPGLPPKAIVVGAPAAAVPVESVQIEQPKSVDIIKDSEWNEIFASISGSNSFSSSSTLTTVDDSVSQPNSGTVQTTVPRTEIIETPKDTRKIAVNVPPNGYICYRCNIAGHFIQHCPTNGDPNYDIKRMKVAGFPMEKEVKKIPSNANNNNNNMPFEFYCKLCTNIMDNSVMTRCCFASFCEKCIKNFIFSNFKCFCGVTNIINDHLLPNITLRKIITGRIDNNQSKGLSSELSSNNKNDETCMVVSSRAAPKRKLYEHRNDMHGHMKKFKSGSNSKPARPCVRNIS